MAGRNPNIVNAASRALARSALVRANASLRDYRPRTPTSHAIRAGTKLEEELRSIVQRDPYVEVRQTGTILPDGGLTWGTIRSAVTGRSFTITITRLGVPMVGDQPVMGTLGQAVRALG